MTIEAGIVTTQPHTIFFSVLKSTASPFIKFVPIIEPIIQWLVLTGQPNNELIIIAVAVPNWVAKLLVGVKETNPPPTVSIVKRPNNKIPKIIENITLDLLFLIRDFFVGIGVFDKNMLSG